MTFLPLGFPTATDKEEKMSKKKSSFFFPVIFFENTRQLERIIHSH